MKRDRGVEIDVGDVVATDNHKRFGEPICDLPDCARTAHELRLMQVLDVDAEGFAVTDISAHRFWEIVDVDDDVINAASLHILDDVTDDRAAEHGHERFGQFEREGVKPSGKPSGQDHPFHAPGPSMCTSVSPLLSMWSAFGEAVM